MNRGAAITMAVAFLLLAGATGSAAIFVMVGVPVVVATVAFIAAIRRR